MIKRTSILFVCAIVFNFSISSVQANLAFDLVGTPTPSGSWYQGFHLTTQTNFNNLGLILTPMATDDGTSGFKPPAWDLSVSPLGSASATFNESLSLGSWLTVASGASTDELYWRSHFLGNMATQDFVLTAFTFDNYLSPDSVQVAAARWDGSVWDFYTPPAVTWDEFVTSAGTDLNSVVAPVPSAALLALLGLIVCVPLARKFSVIH